MWKKQTNCKSSQDRYKIPSCWNSSFPDKQIICLCSADYMQRNSVLIKVHLQNRLFTKSCITQTEILLVSFLMYFIFHISPKLLLLEFNNTLLYQNVGWGNCHKNINIPLPFYQSSVTPHLSSVKTTKILISVRKFKHMRDTDIDWGLCILLVQMLKKVSISFINSEMAWTLYLVWLLSNL